MYFKSRMFKFITVTLTIVLLVFVFFYFKGNLDKYDYKFTQKKDFAVSTKYVKLNDGDNYTNDTNVTLKVANDNIEVNYIQYQSCFDNGKTHCSDWSETIYIGEKLGVQMESEDVWSRNISLYTGNLDIDKLQGRHFVKVRYISRVEIGTVSIKIIDTKKAYIYLDTYAPTLDSSLNYEWTTKDYITINYKDNKFSPSYMNSGVKKITYSTCVSYDINPDGSYTCNTIPNLITVKAKTKGSFKIPVVLEKTLINITLMDKAGNTSTWTQVIKMDREKPIVDINIDVLSDLKNAGNAIVDVNDEGSKISSVSYVFTKTSTKPSDSKFTNKLTAFSNVSIDLPTEHGKYYLWVRAEDYAGNVTYKHSDYFYICDDDISCSKIQPKTKNYTSVLYIAIAAALVASIGIVSVMNNRRKKMSSND